MIQLTVKINCVFPVKPKIGRQYTVESELNQILLGLVVGRGLHVVPLKKSVLVGQTQSYLKADTSWSTSGLGQRQPGGPAAADDGLLHVPIPQSIPAAAH